MISSWTCSNCCDRHWRIDWPQTDVVHACSKIHWLSLGSTSNRPLEDWATTERTHVRERGETNDLLQMFSLIRWPMVDVCDQMSPFCCDRPSMSTVVNRPKTLSSIWATEKISFDDATIRRSHRSIVVDHGDSHRPSSIEVVDRPSPMTTTIFSADFLVLHSKNLRTETNRSHCPSILEGRAHRRRVNQVRFPLLSRWSIWWKESRTTTKTKTSADERDARFLCSRDLWDCHFAWCNAGTLFDSWIQSELNLKYHLPDERFWRDLVERMTKDWHWWTQQLACTSFSNVFQLTAEPFWGECRDFFDESGSDDEDLTRLFGFGMCFVSKASTSSVFSSITFGLHVGQLRGEMCRSSIEIFFDSPLVTTHWDGIRSIIWNVPNFHRDRSTKSDTDRWQRDEGGSEDVTSNFYWLQHERRIFWTVFLQFSAE